VSYRPLWSTALWSTPRLYRGDWWLRVGTNERRSRTGERYESAASDVVRDIEREVMGAVWGANGFTTVAQADLLIDRIDLKVSHWRCQSVGTALSEVRSAVLRVDVTPFKSLAY
jgi:hypothetical protein